MCMCTCTTYIYIHTIGALLYSANLDPYISYIYIYDISTYIESVSFVFGESKRL